MDASGKEVKLGKDQICPWHAGRMENRHTRDRRWWPLARDHTAPWREIEPPDSSTHASIASLRT